MSRNYNMMRSHPKFTEWKNKKKKLLGDIFGLDDISDYDFTKMMAETMETLEGKKRKKLKFEI